MILIKNNRVGARKIASTLLFFLMTNTTFVSLVRIIVLIISVFMKRFIYLFIAAAALMTGCAKEEGPDSPAPEQETAFAVQQTQLTQGSFSARIIPEDNEAPYYFGVVTKKEFDETYSGKGEDLQAAYLSWFEQMAQQQGITLEELLTNALLTGMQDYQFRSLIPDTEYVFFVFGVDYTGKATTEVETDAFKTPKATLNHDAKFSITPVTVGSTFFIVDIECSDPDIFYYYDVMMPSVYEYYCGSNPANITSYMESYLSALKNENDNYAAMSMGSSSAASQFQANTPTTRLVQRQPIPSSRRWNSLCSQSVSQMTEPSPQSLP